MRIFDTHAHFTGTPEETAAAIARAKEAGVAAIMAAGGDAKANAGVHDAIAASPEGVVGAVGYDRESIDDERPPLDYSGMKAAGEMGLDYFYDPDSRDRQIALFEEQIAAAAELGLPAIIHTRSADDDTINILKASAARAVIHCFTGSRQFCRKLLDLGAYVSISGIVTFKSADNVREVATYIPDDRLLIETDSPFLAPTPMRGKPNEPQYLVHTAKFLAALRGKDFGQFAQMTFKNGQAAFGL